MSAPIRMNGVFVRLSVGIIVYCLFALLSTNVLSAAPAVSKALSSSTTTTSNAVGAKSKAVGGDGALSEDFLGDDEIDPELATTQALSTFDHIATGFPLTGRHNQIDCQVCHLGGIFTELPTQCRACHDGNLAPGVPDVHVLSTENCDTCHTTDDFSVMAAVVFDHSLIGNANCVSCHDGIVAIGKSVNHLVSSDVCDTCHTTVAWNDINFDHTGITQACYECHNGISATTRSAIHMPSSTACENCHIFVAWVPAIRPVDHAEVIGSCSTCHDGSAKYNNQVIIGKNAAHIISSDSCEACHSVSVFRPEIKVDHDHVLGSCASCHDGVRATGKSALHIRSTEICEDCHLSTVWAPAKVVDHSQVLGSCTSCHDGVIARGKDLDHIETILECNACHAKTQWLPVFGAIDHTAFSGNCITCHNGTTASGKGANHISATDVCDACHQVAPDVWASVAPSAVDHAQIIGSCISCHNNVDAVGQNPAHISTTDNCELCHEVAPLPWKPVLSAAVDHSQVVGSCISCHNNAPIVGKGPTHIATTDNCEACHAVGPAKWTPVLVANVDHGEVLGNCITCHDNALYPGKNATHILTTNDNCQACHEVGPAAWKPLIPGRMDHQEVLGVCSSCHDNVIARGKHATHVVTVEECNACHGVTAWLPAAQDHSTYFNNCITCHDGVIASGKTNLHFPATDTCDACHEKFPATWRPVPASAVDHSQLSGTCISCHDGGFAPGKSVNHMSTTDSCDACHAVGPTPWAPVLPAAVDHTQVIGACETCHNDVVAGGKAGRHSVINTTDNCAACHAPSPVAWISILPVDHNEVIGVCSSCHDGVIATGKNFITNHIVTTKECDTCHTTSAWLPAGVDHSTITGNCISCHDGVTASGKSTSHIASTNVCEACHDKAPARWVDVAANRVDHTQVSGTCISCHNGVVASGKGLTHIRSSDTCEACHKSGPVPWAPILNSAVNHAHVQGTCISCHNNLVAGGKTPNVHMPTSDTCNACHSVGPTPWTPVLSAAVNHVEVLGVCSDCHNGGFAADKGPNHITTTINCQACHQPGPVPWSPVPQGGVDHTEVLGTCSSCHDGTKATGKTVNHVVTALECNQCHATTAWLPAAIDHSGFNGNCIDCHDGVIASGKSLAHILTSNVCDACHAKSPALWTPVLAAAVDHTQVSGTCFSCHNNAPIIGKNTGHIPTTNVCEKCHAQAQFPIWKPLPQGAVDHLEVQGLCADCHNGTLARGKGPTHVTTALACDSCHVTTSWLTTTTVDHSTIISNCISCHDGVTASGKSLAHIATTNNCEQCHQKFPARWTPVAANAVNHNFVLGACDTCHNNAPIAGKSANHPATSNNCNGCHNVGPAKWLPLLASISHLDALGTCVSCHTPGGISTGKSASHPTTTNNCVACHNIPPGTWTAFITPLNHAEVLGTCVSCHNGTVTSGKSGGHPATSDNCDLCHSVPPTPWTQFTTPLDHAEVLGSCVSCHTPGGVGAPKSANHPNTTDNCQPCHRVSPAAWLPFIAPLDHNEVLGTCVVCHNSTGIATPKSGNHPATTDTCDACHNVPPQTWLPYISPVDHNEVLGSCVSCHTPGGVGAAKPGGHILSTDFCDACHNKPPLTWLPFITPLNHNEVLGTCASCHNLPGGHPNTTTICEACHSIPPTPWITFITPLDHGQVLGTCVSCHTPGGVATPKSAGHPLTTDVCDACHLSPPAAVGWTGAAIIVPFAHTDALGLCTDCHATGIATPVNGGHCTPLGGDCDLCHSTTSFLNPTADCGAVTAPPAPGTAPPVPAPPPAPAPAPPAAGMGGPGGGMGGM